MDRLSREFSNRLSFLLHPYDVFENETSEEHDHKEHSQGGVSTFLDDKTQVLSAEGSDLNKDTVTGKSEETCDGNLEQDDGDHSQGGSATFLRVKRQETAQGSSDPNQGAVIGKARETYNQSDIDYMGADHSGMHANVDQDCEKSQKVFSDPIRNIASVGQSHDDQCDEYGGHGRSNRRHVSWAPNTEAATTCDRDNVQLVRKDHHEGKPNSTIVNIDQPNDPVCNYQEKDEVQEKGKLDITKGLHGITDDSLTVYDVPRSFNFPNVAKTKHILSEEEFCAQFLGAAEFDEQNDPSEDCRISVTSEVDDSNKGATPCREGSVIKYTQVMKRTHQNFQFGESSTLNPGKRKARNQALQEHDSSTLIPGRRKTLEENAEEPIYDTIKSFVSASSAENAYAEVYFDTDSAEYPPEKTDCVKDEQHLTRNKCEVPVPSLQWVNNSSFIQDINALTDRPCTKAKGNTSQVVTDDPLEHESELGKTNVSRGEAHIPGQSFRQELHIQFLRMKNKLKLHPAKEIYSELPNSVKIGGSDRIRFHQPLCHHTKIEGDKSTDADDRVFRIITFTYTEVRCVLAKYVPVEHKKKQSKKHHSHKFGKVPTDGICESESNTRPQHEQHEEYRVEASETPEISSSRSPGKLSVEGKDIEIPTEVEVFSSQDVHHTACDNSTDDIESRADERALLPTLQGIQNYAYDGSDDEVEIHEAPTLSRRNSRKTSVVGEYIKGPADDESCAATLQGIQNAAYEGSTDELEKTLSQLKIWREAKETQDETVLRRCQSVPYLQAQDDENTQRMEKKIPQQNLTIRRSQSMVWCDTRDDANTRKVSLDAAYVQDDLRENAENEVEGSEEELQRNGTLDGHVCEDYKGNTCEEFAGEFAAGDLTRSDAEELGRNDGREFKGICRGVQGYGTEGNGRDEADYLEILASDETSIDIESDKTNCDDGVEHSAIIDIEQDNDTMQIDKDDHTVVNIEQRDKGSDVHFSVIMVDGKMREVVAVPEAPVLNIRVPFQRRKRLRQICAWNATSKVLGSIFHCLFC